MGSLLSQADDRGICAYLAPTPPRLQVWRKTIALPAPLQCSGSAICKNVIWSMPIEVKVGLYFYAPPPAGMARSEECCDSLSH